MTRNPTMTRRARRPWRVHSLRRRASYATLDRAVRVATAEAQRLHFATSIRNTQTGHNFWVEADGRIR